MYTVFVITPIKVEVHHDPQLFLIFESPTQTPEVKDNQKRQQSKLSERQIDYKLRESDHRTCDQIWKEKL